MIQNGVTLVTQVTAVLALLAFGIGSLCYGIGKAGDSPRHVQWGKNGWLGGGVLTVSATLISVFQNLATRIAG